jgi:hypothetical protein
MRLSIKTFLQKKILYIGFSLASGSCFAQSNNIIVKGDTLILDNGSKFWIGEEVTLGTGLAPDKSFVYIYESPVALKNILLSSKKRKSIPIMYAGHAGMIKKFEKDGLHKKDYVYNIIVLQFVDGKQYWCDVQNALTNNEILSGLPDITLTNTFKNEKDSLRNDSTSTRKKTVKKPVTAF